MVSPIHPRPQVQPRTPGSSGLTRSGGTGRSTAWPGRCGVWKECGDRGDERIRVTCAIAADVMNPSNKRIKACSWCAAWGSSDVLGPND
jgi:hypothetical protein